MKIQNINYIKLVLVAIGLSLLLTSLTPQAATTSWKSPSENSGDFKNPDGAYSNGKASATARPGSQHQYWGYNFNLPDSAKIQGIEVRVDGRRSGKGDVRFKVELSWDGGNNWVRGLKTNFLTNKEQTYILGGPTQTWGHTWKASGLSDSNFRVKITASGSKNSKLDWIPVRIHYKSQSRTPPENIRSVSAITQAPNDYCTPDIGSSEYEEIEAVDWIITGNTITVTVDVKIKSGNSSNYTDYEHVLVWIDWDGDQTFSLLSFDFWNMVSDNYPPGYEGTMTFKDSTEIPDDTVPCTWIRTALRYGDWSDFPSRCGKWDYGDYEDYQISLPATDYSVTDNLTNLTINQTDLDQWFGDPAEKQQSLDSFDVTVTSGQEYQVNACYEVSPTPTPSFSGDPLRIENPENSGTFTWIKKCSDPNSSHLLGFNEEANCPNCETNTYPTEIDLSKLGDRASGETFTFTIDVTVVNPDT